MNCFTYKKANKMRSVGGVGVGFDAGADVPAEAFAVEPGLGAMIVADVENVEDIREVASVKPWRTSTLWGSESVTVIVSLRTAGVQSVLQFTGLMHITVGWLTTGLIYSTSDTEL